jgi:PAS domain S-box-containing protein
MLLCALVTVIGSLIAWSGFVKLERHAVSTTRQAWQTADACMELWIAALSLDRARERGTQGDLARAREQFEWARRFTEHALGELETTGDIDAAKYRQLAELARGIVSDVDALLDGTAAQTPQELVLDRRAQLEARISDALHQIETVILPEEQARDAVMDQAATDGIETVREYKRYLGVVVVLGIVAALVLAAMLSKRFSRPIKALAEMTRRIGDGSAKVSPSRQVPGEIYELTQNFEQMTQRLERSREQLVASEARYRALFEYARHGIAVLTPDGTILEANHALGRLTGCSLEALKGRPVATIVNSAEAPLSEVLDSLASNPQGLAELELISAGAPIPVDIGSVDLPDGRRVVVFRDTRQQRSMQQALIQSEKLSAVGQLAAGVAHELRNPLFVISNVLYDLKDTVGPSSDEAAESLRIAEQENARARKIIDNLLEFSRTAPGTMEVRLELAVRQVIALFARSLQDRKIEVVLDLTTTPPCRFEPDSLKQVLVNLITNAADAMPQGGRLEIATSRMGAGHAQLTVADTGEGIPAEKRREIFNPFYTSKPPGTGTGLGLWIVHSTMTRYRGRIDVESTPGQGTTFTLEFEVAMEQTA